MATAPRSAETGEPAASGLTVTTARQQAGTWQELEDSATGNAGGASAGPAANEVATDSWSLKKMHDLRPKRPEKAHFCLPTTTLPVVVLVV